MVVGLSLPAAAQQGVGRFPKSAPNPPAQNAPEDNVLPFVEGGSGTLPPAQPEPQAEAGSQPQAGPSLESPSMEKTEQPRPNQPKFADSWGDLAEARKSSAETSEAADSSLPPFAVTPEADAAVSSQPNAPRTLDRLKSQTPSPAAESQENLSSAPDSELSPFAVKEPPEKSKVRTASATSPVPSQTTTPTPSEPPPQEDPPPPAAEEQAEQTGKATTPESGKESSSAWSWESVLSWIRVHGLRLAVILIVTLVLLFIAKILANRIVRALVRGSSRGTPEEREARANTLVGVFHNTATAVIVVAGILTACQEVGIAIAPLLGGAAVFGLAAAFGAQSLIKDYFYGFMILLENQYRLDDIVEIAGVAGTVERITMRITVLRDLAGNVYFVPNGTITTVTNMTYGWARAVLEIRTAYQQDADRAMGVLSDVARELREDPDYGPMTLEDAEMHGVQDLGDSAVLIRFVIKTHPQAQWAVRREMLRRIKRRFDELDIEIPYPHLAIQYASGQPADGDSAGKGPAAKRESGRAA